MTYPLTYKPELAEKLLDFFRDGSSITKVAAVKLGVSRQTYYEWKDKYPEFKKAAELGEQIAEATQEDLLDRGIMGEIEDFGMSGQVFKMKSRYRSTYADSPKTSPEDDKKEPPIVININGNDVTSG